MAAQGVERATAQPLVEPDVRLEQFRSELVGYCYRMLGASFEAEDAVQETLMRAWQKIEVFDEGRASLRSWLYSIATNICLDMLRSPQRRARAMDLGPSSTAGVDLGRPLPDATWIQPMPDNRVLAADGDPAEVAAQRETIRLAFVAALQHLPPRQRAVLILRDVLRWKAHEVARLLDTTVSSVTSALQRARMTLHANHRVPVEPFQPLDGARQDLLNRYCAAFEQYDVDTLVSLLHEDATMSMPPYSWWLQGRAEIRRALHSAGHPCAGARLVPTFANGSPAFGQYRPADGGRHHVPFALVVLELSGQTITDVTTYLDGERLFPLFGLPVVR